MKKIPFQNKKGFTLIETLLYVVIIGAVLWAFTSFILTISASRNKSYSQQEVNANTRMALSKVTHIIKLARGINVADSTFGTNPGVLSLSMASSTLNPTVIASNGSQLILTEGLGAPQPITSQDVRLTNLVFTNLSTGSNRGNVGIDMNFSFATSSGTEYTFTSHVQTSVSLR